MERERGAGKVSKLSLSSSNFVCCERLPVYSSVERERERAALACLNGRKSLTGSTPLELLLVGVVYVVTSGHVICRVWAI